MRVISLSQLSLVGGSGIAEAKQPIWWSDGTVNAASGSSATTAGSVMLVDGGTNAILSSSASNQKLFTLSSTWPSTLKFSLEASIMTNNATATASAELYDFTSASLISGSSVSTTSTTMTVIRSSQFNLIPGHVYGVTIWISNSSYDVEVSDASLIIFPS